MWQEQGYVWCDSNKGLYPFNLQLCLIYVFEFGPLLSMQGAWMTGSGGSTRLDFLSWSPGGKKSQNSSLRHKVPYEYL